MKDCLVDHIMQSSFACCSALLATFDDIHTTLHSEPQTVASLQAFSKFLASAERSQDDTLAATRGCRADFEQLETLSVPLPDEAVAAHWRLISCIPRLQVCLPSSGL